MHATDNLYKAKTANLRSWGSTENSNILYITGHSGSGKTLTANLLKSPYDELIELDAYAEDGNHFMQNQKLNAYLDEHVSNWDMIHKDAERTSSLYFKKVDEFREAIESFAKREYKIGSRVIVDGIQIADGWLDRNLANYAGKPIVILQDGPFRSLRRAFRRDGRGGLIKGIRSLDNPKETITWCLSLHKCLRYLECVTGAKKDERS